MPYVFDPVLLSGTIEGCSHDLEVLRTADVRNKVEVVFPVVWFVLDTILPRSDYLELAKGIVSGKSVKVKILGKGDIDVKLKIDVEAISASAKEKILAKGGEIVGEKAADASKPDESEQN